MKYHIVMKEGYVSRGSEQSVWMNKDIQYARSFVSATEASNYAEQMLMHFAEVDKFYVIVRCKE